MDAQPGFSAPPRRRPHWLHAGLLLLAACGEPAPPDAPLATAASAAEDSAAACRQLAGLRIAAETIGEPSSGAEVRSADLVAAGASDNANGEYCKVLAVVLPVDPAAPLINVEVNLPTRWNGRLLQFGGGGLNGTLVSGLGRYAKQPPDEPTPLAQGYVTLGSDSGHQSQGGFDGRFYLDEEALTNFGHQQVKKTHDVAVQLVRARYGREAEFSYFVGGSQGGHEGFDAVQRYPDDYDGVVAGYPAHNVVMLHLAAWHYAGALLAADGAGWLDPAAAQFLVGAVYGRCDPLDGATDGIIANVAACRAATAPFKLQSADNPIRCAGDSAAGDLCLSDAQIGALNLIDSPYRVGFPIFPDDGASAGFPKWTPFEGSTFTDGGLAILGAEGPAQALQHAPGAATLGLAIAQDPDLDVYAGFDPLEHRQRIVDLAFRMSANSTDLDRFRARGGKLIFYHGLVDDFITPYSSIQYWTRLQQRYDAATLGSFVKFYTIPGMGHQTGVFNARLPALTALVAWVEEGVEPGTLVASDANEATLGRTRPVCQYPAWPRYGGMGSLDEATSFACVEE